MLAPDYGSTHESAVFESGHRVFQRLGCGFDSRFRNREADVEICVCADRGFRAMHRLGGAPGQGRCVTDKIVGGYAQRRQSDPAQPQSQTPLQGLAHHVLGDGEGEIRPGAQAE